VLSTLTRRDEMLIAAFGEGKNRSSGPFLPYRFQ
jgi:hypothetical protein